MKWAPQLIQGMTTLVQASNELFRKHPAIWTFVWVVVDWDSGKCRWVAVVLSMDEGLPKFQSATISSHGRL